MQVFATYRVSFRYISSRWTSYSDRWWSFSVVAKEFAEDGWQEGVMPKTKKDHLQKDAGGRFPHGVWMRGNWMIGAAMLLLAVFTRTTQAAETLAVLEHPAFVVKSVGSGQAVILIPGLSSSASTWDGTVDHLKGRFHCITINLAGFAGVAPVPGVTLAIVRDQLAAYIQSAHLDRPILIGHSLGGSIALDLAARNPTLVGPVVIVDSLPFMAQAWFGVDSLDAAQPTLVQMGAGMRAMSGDQWKAYVQSGATTRTLATAPADQQKLVDWGLSSDQKAVTDTMMEMLDEDLRAELKNIQTPVLVIGTWAGLEAQGVTRASVTKLFEEQYAGVKNLDLVIAEKERHFVMWDNPKWFDATVDGFLNKTAATDKGTGE